MVAAGPWLPVAQISWQAQCAEPAAGGVVAGTAHGEPGVQILPQAQHFMNLERRICGRRTTHTLQEELGGRVVAAGPRLPVV